MARVIGWLRPRQGWGLLILLALSVMSMAGTITAAGWVERDDVFITLALIAVLLGRWAEGRAWRTRTRLLLALDTGLLAVLIATAGGMDRVGELILRWRAWLRIAVGEGQASDPAIFLLYVAMLIWGAAFFAGWWFATGRNVLVGFFPLLLLGALSAIFAHQGSPFLFFGLFCTLLLAAGASLHEWQVRWRATQVGFPFDLELDVYFLAGGLAFLLVVLGLLMPTINFREVARWVGERFSQPAQRAEEEAGRLFGGVRLPRRDEAVAVGSLPHRRMLRGQPERAQLEVFRVWTGVDIEPYWREISYDLYTGRGWEATITTERPLTTSLPAPPGPDYRDVVQVFHYARQGGGAAVTLAEPLAVEGEGTGLWHEAEDLAGLEVPGPAYTATSRILQPEVGDLRDAPASYPDDVTARYLQLPPDLPQRVRVLAEEVVAGAETPYERALRIERYLRSYRYTLEVEPASPDQDVVDYFLFDLQEGYCDYYATAFVVMARSVGIPSRLVSGYGGGRVDAADGSIVVMDTHAHSWPEVYFPGWGWIAFEPTAGRMDLALSLEGEEVPEGGAVNRPDWQVWGVGSGLVLLLLIAGIAGWYRYHTGKRVDSGPLHLPQAWQQLVAEGQRLGLPRRPGQTVVEYAQAIGAELARRSGVALWDREGWQAQADEARRELDLFAILYTHYLYGSGPECVERPDADFRRPLSLFRRLPPLFWRVRRKRKEN